jgi:type III restriction enzyme
VSVSSKRGTISSAKVELDVKTATGDLLQEVTVSDGDDLQQTTKRDIYADFRVGEISTAKRQRVLVRSVKPLLTVGQATAMM